MGEGRTSQQSYEGIPMFITQHTADVNGMPASTISPVPALTQQYSVV
jgi:hypothetical protein